MALRGYKTPLIIFLGTILWAQALAQSGCTTAIISLAPCMNFISGNSSTPSSSCCSQLSNVVQTQARCLCTVLNGAVPFGISINQTQAMTLPGACQIQTPPLSQCNAVAPATSPTAESPEEAPAFAPALAPALVPASPSVPSTPTVPSQASPPTTPTVPSQASPPTTSSVPSIPSGNGSKTVPSTSGQSSDGSSIKLTLPLFFILLFMASYLSTIASF